MEQEKPRILLVEDERAIAMAITKALTEEGMHVFWASDGAKGLEIALQEDFALVLLDVLLPHKNGWDICRELRDQKSYVPIMMLTALDDVEDRVKGLQLGADDDLAKPFELAELMARIHALLRREQLGRDLVTRVADLEIDRKTRQVSRHGTAIRLNRREYDLLEALASNTNTILDHDTLQRRVWTDDEAFDRTVDVFVSTLKRKVDLPFDHDLIHSVPDGGYVLSDRR
jgi:two-component system, OmpR family, copper resistance phosphate regulon response regulator CusR